MRTVVQRVESAFLDANGVRIGAIGPGLVLLAGIERDDTDEHLAWTARKIATLRVFEDTQGKMNLALADLAALERNPPPAAPTSPHTPDTDASDTRASGTRESGTRAPVGVLIVPNFTVAGDATKGRRPSFDTAKPPADAKPLFDRFADTIEHELANTAVTTVRGVFGADMRVGLVNDGPVTLVLQSPA